MIVTVRRIGRFWLEQTIELPDDTPPEEVYDRAVDLSDELGWSWDEADHESERVEVDG